MTEVLPSISAVIGGFEWQRFIWTFSVAITTGPRLAFCYLQRANLREKFNSKLGAIKLNFFLNCVEILSLLTLSLGKDLEKCNNNRLDKIKQMLKLWLKLINNKLF